MFKVFKRLSQEDFNEVDDDNLNDDWLNAEKNSDKSSMSSFDISLDQILKRDAKVINNLIFKVKTEKD